MNVAETMYQVIPKLKMGLDDIRFPDIRPECEDMWNEGYAIVNGFWYDYPDSEYFDNDQFRQDYEKMVKELFPECNINFYWKSQEIEVIKL